MSEKNVPAPGPADPALEYFREIVEPAVVADDTNTDVRPVVTLADAKAAGLTRFRTNRPCCRGHIADRYVAKGGCVTCATLDSAARVAANPEAKRAYNAAYKAAHQTEAQRRKKARRVSRVEAKAAGLKYYHGKPCKRGHSGERYVISNDCVDCGNIKSAARHAANPEAARARNAEYQATHREENRLRRKVWREANPERDHANRVAWWTANPGKKRDYEIARRSKEPRTAWNAAYQVKNRVRLREYREENRYTRKAVADVWRKANPEKIRARTQNRRARLLRASGTHTAADIEALFKLQRGKCAHPWCGKCLADGYHVDHVMPLARGGSNDKRNLALLCASCNFRKNAKHPVDFAQENGFLL